MSKGITYISTTSNPSMIFARKNDTLWVTTRIGRCSSGSGSGKIQNKNKKGSTSNARITVSFEYVGLRDSKNIVKKVAKKIKK